MLELAFVTAPRQNHFFVELIAAIRDELDQAGIANSKHEGDFPPLRDGLVYVLVPPHEWFALHGYKAKPTNDQLRRTVFLCAEQPETSFFLDNALLAPWAGAVFDINPGSPPEFDRYSIEGVRHFQLGWTRTWSTISETDLTGEAAAEGRDIDILHLGVHSDRRARQVAGMSRLVSRHRSHLVLAHPDTPNDARRTNFAVDDAKLRLLRRSKVLLNVHQGELPYFEWLRVVQAIAQGCAVVTEHSLSHAPLELGRHLVAGSVDSVGLLAAGMLADEEERARLALDAFVFLRDQLPMRDAVAEVVAAAWQLAEAPLKRRVQALPPLSSPVADGMDLDDVFHGPADSGDEMRRTSVMRSALKDLRLEMMQLRRDLRRSDLEVSSGRSLPAVALEATTPAWRLGGAARVSVITPLYNHARHIRAALESALESTFDDLELIVVDDGSNDDSRARVNELMADRPDREIALARHPVNRGLGSARNSALALARGELVFVLDADNLVLRHGIARLVEELHQEQDVQAAYGMLERFDNDGPIGLISAFPWEPRRLRNGNYIDAMALWRTAALRELGGYTTDHRLYGWEDYDLWCRLAERDGNAAFVTQVVARYRASRHSMISTTDLSVTTAFSVLCERYPQLLSGVNIPA